SSSLVKEVVAGGARMRSSAPRDHPVLRTPRDSTTNLSRYFNDNVQGMSVVEVTDLNMTYRVPVRDAGLGAALKSIVRRRYREVHAVRDVSFELAPGEVVGFIGPNGAGKTTTMKILSGILHPTS